MKKFYELNVYHKSNNMTGVGIATHTYFTSLEKAGEEVKKICKKYSANEEPYLFISDSIVSKCRHRTKDHGYTSVYLRVVDEMFVYYNGNIIEELREARS